MNRWDNIVTDLHLGFDGVWREQLFRIDPDLIILDHKSSFRPYNKESTSSKGHTIDTINLWNYFFNNLPTKQPL